MLWLFTDGHSKTIRVQWRFCDSERENKVDGSTQVITLSDHFGGEE